ncbi:MAG TPA: hypothetical protein VJK52_03285 [Candidatus Nanoarchaeia archaeon]|nr:hypothetical protein [Candidatus Nanoarchaeia archaeon]
MQKGVFDGPLRKRGVAALSDSLFVLFELILVLVVGATLGLMVRDLGKNPEIEQQYYATELALLIDTVQAAPGSVILGTSAPKLNLTARIEKNKVTVQTDARSATALFHPDRFLKEEYRNLQSQRKATVTKGPGVFRIAQQALREPPRGPVLPIIDTAQSGVRSILIRGKTPELQQMLQYVVEGAPNTENPHISVFASPGDRLRILIPDNTQSRKLATLFARELSIEAPIVPLSFDYLPESPLRDTVGMLIEIPEQQRRSEIGIALQHAVQEYFQPNMVLPIGGYESEVIGRARVFALS